MNVVHEARVDEKKEGVVHVQHWLEFEDGRPVWMARFRFPNGAWTTRAIGGIDEDGCFSTYAHADDVPGLSFDHNGKLKVAY